MVHRSHRRDPLILALLAACSGSSAPPRPIDHAMVAIWAGLDQPADRNLAMRNVELRLEDSPESAVRGTLTISGDGGFWLTGPWVGPATVSTRDGTISIAATLAAESVDLALHRTSLDLLIDFDGRSPSLLIYRLSRNGAAYSTGLLNR